MDDGATPHRPGWLSERSIVRVAGDDAVDFLQALVTQDVTAPLPLWAGLLSPQGKRLFDFLMWPDPHGDAILLDVATPEAGALIRRLSLYRLRRAVDIAIDLGLAALWSLHRFDGAVPDPRLPMLGCRAVAPMDAAGGPVDAAYAAHRLALGIAEGPELSSDAVLWLEANAAELHGVSFTKGCYVGQENTARMNWRAKVNRRIRVVPAAEARPDRVVGPAADDGWSVELRRVADEPADAWPRWLAPALPARADQDQQAP